MILKGAQRAGGTDLATHLLNRVDNETVELAEIRGAASADLQGAFAEFEATAAGTRCKEPFYSLSVNPPVPIDRAAYFAAIERIEKRLGLDGQPRAVIFHVKNGREHAHVVWSRIHAEGDHLKAIPLSHDKSKLCALSCDFFRELNIPLPEGLAAWEERQPGRDLRSGRDYTRAEKIQSEQTGIPVADRRAAITEAYRASDSAEAFRAALEARGYTLAVGDKRAFVVIDHSGAIFSLARQVEGARTREIKARLAGIAGVPDVQKAQAIIKQRDQARLDRAREEMRTFTQQREREQKKREREQQIVAFIQRVRLARIEAEERLVLKAKHKAEREQVEAARASALRRALAKVPGLAAMIRYFQNMADIAQLERQRLELEALRRKQHIRILQTEHSDRFHDRLARREARAHAQHTMLKEYAKAWHRQKLAKAQGKTAAFAVNPEGLTVREWHRRYRQNASDITAPAVPLKRQHTDSFGPAVDAHDRAREEAKMLRRRFHEMRQNASDITAPPAPTIGAADTRAADIFAAIHRDRIRSARTASSSAPPPASPHINAPQSPKDRH